MLRAQHSTLLLLMTSHTRPSVPITLPITRLAQETANQFAQQQPNLQKAAQVRLNTLAVWAVRDYCQKLNIPTDLMVGDSWHPLKRLEANVADLELVGIGRLECRPVQADDRACQIPFEVWDNRIGYVSVQIDQDAGEATLLGFVPTATREFLPLEQLQSIHTLIKHVQSVPTRIVHTVATTATYLSEWGTEQGASDWQTIEALLDMIHAEPAFTFRSATAEMLPTAEDKVRRAKLIHLLAQESDYPLALVIEVLIRSDQRRNIYVQVYTLESGMVLPEHLGLQILDQAGEVVLATQARQADDYAQLRFRGVPGEAFQVQITLKEDALIENFVI